MVKRLFTITASLLFLISCKNDREQNLNETQKSDDLTGIVNPFIGTGGHGHTFPGVSRPFGMVQVSPDNGTSGWDWCSGYHYSDSLVAGFSHLHLSGTGIGDLADLLFMPVNKKIDLTKLVKERNDIPYLSKYSHDNETSKPGYYQLFLEDFDVNVELTSSLRTGYHTYTFGEGEEQSVVIDLGFAINWDEPTATSIKIENEHTITGYRHSKGWAKNQKVFFVAKFSKPIINSELYTEAKLSNASEVEGKKTSAQLFFDKEDKKLQVAVALSSVSLENAKENLDSDGNFNFDEIEAESKEVWNKALSISLTRYFV